MKTIIGLSVKFEVKDLTKINKNINERNNFQVLPFCQTQKKLTLGIYPLMHLNNNLCGENPLFTFT